MSSFILPVARRVCNDDLVVISLDGISYYAKTCELEQMQQFDVNAGLYVLYPDFIQVGSIHLAKSGRTTYVECNGERYRYPTRVFMKMTIVPNWFAIGIRCDGVYA